MYLAGVDMNVDVGVCVCTNIILYIATQVELGGISVITFS